MEYARLELASIWNADTLPAMPHAAHSHLSCVTSSMKFPEVMSAWGLGDNHPGKGLLP